MDPVTMVFYGAVCGTLALASPHVPRPWQRVVIGIVIGAVAATILPMLRRLLGI